MVKLKGPGLETRLEMPEELKRLQRRAGGMATVPYVQWHEQIARDVLEALAFNHRLRVVEVTMRQAGWFDGMREINAVVEDSRGQTHRLVYCDSNQGFMVACKGGGNGYFRPEELFFG